MKRDRKYSWAKTEARETARCGPSALQPRTSPLAALRSQCQEAAFTAKVG